jgi:effector-binding domain-containing protein
MLEAPYVTQSEEQMAAVIHMTVPRDQIRNAMGPGIQALIDAVRAQGIGPAGPVFSHYFSMQPEAFEFEIGVPVARAVTPSGRVQPGVLPAAPVARAVLHGGYDQLPAAWEEFLDWVGKEGLPKSPDLWEVYVKGPESDPDPATWRTELNQPLLG